MYGSTLTTYQVCAMLGVLIIGVLLMRLKTFHLLTEIIMSITTMSELVAALTATSAQAAKAQAEIVAKIATLQSTIDVLNGTLSNATLTAEQSAAVDAVVVAVQALDDIVPDAPQVV
jgi:hypothetical protein